MTPLDDQWQWYRYHGLFRSLLQQRLEQQYAPDVVTALHRRASIWFARNGFIDEALKHAFAGHNMTMAIQIVTQHRHALMNQEQWHHLTRWIHAFPRAIIDMSPELLLTEAWISQTQFRYFELEDLLTQAETLIDNLSEASSAACHLRGEMAALRSTQYYFVNADSHRVIANSELALKSTPRDWHNVRSIAYIMLGGALQMSGDLDRALPLSSRRFKTLHRHPPYARLDCCPSGVLFTGWWQL